MSIGPWKCYRAWLRLKARRERGERMAQELRDMWTVTKHWEQSLVWLSGENKDKSAGNIIFVGETNGMGERRIRIVDDGTLGVANSQEHCRKLRMSHSNWKEALLWKEGLDEPDTP